MCRFIVCIDRTLKAKTVRAHNANNAFLKADSQVSGSGQLRLVKFI